MSLLSGLLGNAGVVKTEELVEKYGKLLTEGEEIEIGFKVIRDTFMFTNKRLILVDVQGLTGKKQEFLSIPYKSITAFSVETAGSLDLDADLKIWARGLPLIQKKFNKKVNIYDLQSLLSKHVLGL